MTTNKTDADIWTDDGKTVNLKAAEHIGVNDDVERQRLIPIPNDLDEKEALLVGREKVTYKRAADYLGCSLRNVRDRVEKGKLVTVGDGQHKRILSSSLRAYKGTG